eukprot:300328_1
MMDLLLCSFILLISNILTSNGIDYIHKISSSIILNAEDKIYSYNNKAMLYMQSDGNLVLHKLPYPDPYWQSHTSGYYDAYVQFKTNSNLRIYPSANNATSEVVWHSNTWWKDATSTRPYHLVVTDQVTVYIVDSNNITLWTVPTYCDDIGGILGVHNVIDEEELICCTSSCGECGGSNCSEKQAGSSNCCTDVIFQNNKDCDIYSVPCIIHSTKHPTFAPTNIPTKSPSKSTTKFPTQFPTQFPTKFPTQFPTQFPTKSPSTNNPSKYPTKFPSQSPSKYASYSPTKQSINPTIAANNPTRSSNT